eukprot:364801-Chlamydomonas_euryale.AAC.8
MRRKAEEGTVCLLANDARCARGCVLPSASASLRDPRACQACGEKVGARRRRVRAPRVPPGCWRASLAAGPLAPVHALLSWALHRPGPLKYDAHCGLLVPTQAHTRKLAPAAAGYVIGAGSNLSQRRCGCGEVTAALPPSGPLQRIPHSCRRANGRMVVVV